MAHNGHASPASRTTTRRVPFPLERRLVLDTLSLGHHKPMMHGLLEIDVTRPRALLREHKNRTGESISFTAFVLSCIGRAVQAHPEVHALRDHLGRMVLFDEVDATAIVEVEIDGRRFPLAHVIHNLGRRSVRDIHDELRSVQARGTKALPAAAQLGARLWLRAPGFARRISYRALLGFPSIAKRHTGTLLVSAVGMFGQGASWGMSAPGIHNLSVVIGGIGQRAHVDGDALTTRHVLCVTVSANHELVDGAPLARFSHELSTLLERAEGLEEACATSSEGVFARERAAEG